MTWLNRPLFPFLLPNSLDAEHTEQRKGGALASLTPRSRILCFWTNENDLLFQVAHELFNVWNAHSCFPPTAAFSQSMQHPGVITFVSREGGGGARSAHSYFQAIANVS